MPLAHPPPYRCATTLAPRLAGTHVGSLQDAMCVARNVALEPKLVPGGGAVEMAVAAALTEKSKSISGVHQWPYRAVAQALEVRRVPVTKALPPNLVTVLQRQRLHSHLCGSGGSLSCATQAAWLLWFGQ
jgi:hypothetical protein